MVDAAVSRMWVGFGALASLSLLVGCGVGKPGTAIPAATAPAPCSRASDSCNSVQGYAGNAVADGATGATIAGGGQRGAPSRITGDFGTIGGGEGNTAGEGSVIAGGAYNTAIHFRAFVGGGANNVASAWAATVAGGFKNTATDAFATVAGGAVNVASDINATVAGGAGNAATFRYAAVCGGTQNAASSTAAIAAGGEHNLATGAYSAVLGGVYNQADGNQGAIGGGAGNIATGSYSTVPGGFANHALADYSFAAGSRARIQPEHRGVFLFADSEGVPFESLQQNEFAVRAGGGVRFVTAIDDAGEPLSGVRLSPGSGSWETLSDANLKSGFTRVDESLILQRLMNMPISTWSYKGQSSSVRHIGPTAQDFHAAFGLGQDDRYISTVDEGGIALAAIQELYRTQATSGTPGLDARLQSLESRLMASNILAALACAIALGSLWRRHAEATTAPNRVRGAITVTPRRPK
jgi:hypothetical protein